MVILKKTKKKYYTDSFWFDLFEAGYLSPENLVKGRVSINVLEDAIKTLKSYKADIIKAGIVEETDDL